MKILMASSYFVSHIGGLERIAGELFRRIADEDLDITWMAGDVTPAPETRRKSRTVSLRIFNFMEDKTGVPVPIPAPSAFKQIAREVRDADILIIHDCLYLSNIFAFLAARWRRTPTIVIQHIGLVPYRSMALKLVMKLANSVVAKPMLSRAEQVVFYSETTKEYFNGVNFENAPEMILNGVDTELFHTPGGVETKASIRSTYDLPGTCPVILFAGRFVEKKGLPALRHMVRQRPNWTWAFAGWGPLDPTTWNSPNVRVFSSLRGEPLAALYRACDVLVLPSMGEGLPLVIQEALASGLQVVCGAESLRADGAMGTFVRGVPISPGDIVGTARDFLRALDGIIETAPELKPEPEHIRAFAVSRYSWNAAIEGYLNVIARLVPEHSSRSPILVSLDDSGGKVSCMVDGHD